MGVRMGSGGGGGYDYDPAGYADAADVKLSGSSINLRSFGAVGDGATDDATAIKAFEAAILAATGPVTARVPRGSYRFATANPAGEAAIALTGKSDVALVFDPGAELLMDNLSAGSGTSHGIFVKGACSNVRIVGARVRWKTAAGTRSKGDGFHILGYPKASGVTAGWTGSTGTVADLALVNCEAVNTPQCGALLMGCDRPRVTNFLAQSTLADGLHHNACRDLRVSGYTGDRTGDDALPFVTYYAANGDAPTADIYGNQNGPFALATVNDWCNSGAASNVVVRDGSANGVRVSGAYNLSIVGGKVSGKTCGVIIDAGMAGGAYSWPYLAARGLVVMGVSVKACDTGLLTKVHNASSSDDPMWWTFDASLSDLVIRDCTNRQLRVEGPGTTTDAVAGINIRNVRAHASSGAVSFAALRSAVVDGVYTDGVPIEFFGMGANWTGTIAALPDMNLQLDNFFTNGASMTFQDVRRCQIGKVKSSNAPGTAVQLTRVGETTISDLQIVLANRANTGTTRGFFLNTASNITVGRLQAIHDDHATAAWRPVEIGGGSATDVSRDIAIERFVYTNALNQATLGEVVQGGSYAPVNWYVSAEFYNGGEASPIWRTQRFGSTQVVREFAGSGAPAIIAPVGSTYRRTDGGAATSFYVKESNPALTTGWVAK